MSATERTAMPYGWGRVPYTLQDRLPWMNLPFPIEEYHERLDRLRARMRAEGLDCLVVLGNRGESANVRYLSNFEDFYGGETVVVVPASGAPGFATNAVMHGEPMHSGIQDCWIEDVRCAAAPRTVTGGARAATLADHLEDLVRERVGEAARIAVEGEFDAAPLVAAALQRVFPRAHVTGGARLVHAQRTIKSPREVEALRRAAQAADAAMAAAMAAVAPGVSEHDLAAEANYAMFKAGAEHPAFAIAVTAGPRSGFKHLPPTAYRVRAGDIVYIDVGARVQGYCSDGSRQRVCGEPDAEQRRFMETQIRIVEEVLAAARPGVVIGDLARIGTAIAEGAGYGDYLYFRGHGIGVGVQDAPAFAPGNPAVLEENMVFAFEPMLVRRGFGTACWEDMWRVTADGVERLNACPVRWW